MTNRMNYHSIVDAVETIQHRFKPIGAQSRWVHSYVMVALCVILLSDPFGACAIAGENGAGSHVISVVLDEDSENIVAGSSGGVFLYKYPDIEVAMQQLDSIAEMKRLVAKMMRLKLDSGRDRRRSYFAISELVALLHTRNADDRLSLYALGFFDERARREDSSSAKFEAIQASIGLRKRVGFDLLDSHQHESAIYSLITPPHDD